jgi:hypothetical protein
MQFYSRTRPGARDVRQYPGGVITPDGQLHLGLPMRPATADRGAARGDPSSLLASDAAGGVYALMHPAEPNEESASRLPMLLLLAADAGATFGLLLEMRWRTVHRDYLLCIGLIGLAVDVFGAVCAARRLPSMLGIVAIAAFVQFCAIALHLQSLAQLVHCLLQPSLVHFALTLRKACIPVWFSTGRTRIG